MKYLIVGLGNMHPDYEGTRHNVGFEVIDMIAHNRDLSFEHEHLGDLSNYKHKGKSIYLLKPSTFMNLSGKAVRYWMQKLKIKPENVLIVLDDKNIDFEDIRLKAKGSDGGHNGLKDISKMLGSSNYARLRIGIGNNFRKGKQVEFVLGKWSNSELDKLEKILLKASKTAESFATIGLSYTLNEYRRY